MITGEELPVAIKEKINVTIEEDEEQELDEKDEKASKKGFAVSKAIALNDEDQTVSIKEKLPISSEKLSIFIVLAILLFVNLAALTLFFFDVGQIRTNFTIMTNSKLSEQSNQIAIKTHQLEQDKKALDDEKSQFEEEKITVADKEAQLTQKDAELTKRQQDLDIKEKSAAEQTQTTVQTQTPTTTTTDNDNNIKNLVKIYENMDAKNAAKAIVGMKERVQIMKNMKQAKAAEIFDAMDPTQSSIIMSQMINSN